MSPKLTKHDMVSPGGTWLETAPKTGRNWNDGTTELGSSNGNRTDVRFCVIISGNGRGVFRSRAHCYIWSDIGGNPSSGRYVAIAYDFKKEFGELYRPSGKPGVVTVPPMSYVAVRGKGDPNAEGGEYQNALPLLYGVAYAIKMSKKGPREIEGYFDFVVPPLEGF